MQGNILSVGQNQINWKGDWSEVVSEGVVSEEAGSIETWAGGQEEENNRREEEETEQKHTRTNQPEHERTKKIK